MASDGPKAGLSVARQIAMVSYRTASSYRMKFSRDLDPATGQFEVQNYLLYQVSELMREGGREGVVVVVIVVGRSSIGDSVDGRQGT